MTTAAQLSENSHQGFDGIKAALCLGSMKAKSNTASGMPVCLWQEGIRSRSSGKERDAETGLDYFGARYMSGPEGRFMSPDPKQFTERTILYPQKWNKYVYVQNNPLVRIDPDGMDDHHIVVQSLYKSLPLASEARRVFDNAVVYAGKHGWSTLHVQYNALVRAEWGQFFSGIKPQDITEEMANEFVDSLKQNPQAKKLMAEILEKGGVKTLPKWLAPRAGANVLGPALGLAFGVATWMLGNPEELNAAERDWSKQKAKEIEQRKKEEEELRKRGGPSQLIGESETDYEARRQCALGAPGACVR
jgi:RHS repeat-associated protein